MTSEGTVLSQQQISFLQYALQCLVPCVFYELEVNFVNGFETDVFHCCSSLIYVDNC